MDTNAGDRHRVRVLFVGDDVGFRRRVATIAPFRMCESGLLEAASTLAASPVSFAAIVLDVGANRPSALAFVHAIRPDEADKLLVLLPAHADDELARDVQDCAVAKPIAEETLCLMVNLLVRRRSRG